MNQDKLAEISFFDKWFESHDYDVFTESGYQVLINTFKSLAGEGLEQGCRAIDLGCGTGAFTRRMFKSASAKTYGIDLAPGAIQVAERYDRRTRYLTGDIEKLDFPDNHFDLIIYSGVLHHMPSISSTLKEGLRVLKKGGRMLSFDPNLSNPLMWLYRHPDSPFFSDLGKTSNERLLGDEEMENRLKNTGFANVQVFAVSGISFGWVESAVGRRLLPIYNLIDRLLGKLPIASRYGSFLICSGEK